MKSSLDCVPCFLRQALESARNAGVGPEIEERLLREMAQEISLMDFSTPPPVIGRNMHQRLCRLSGIKDPYRPQKQKFNEYVLSLYPQLKSEVMNAPDPFERAVRLSIAGNAIDFGTPHKISRSTLDGILHRARTDPISGSVASLKKRVESATNILYIGDNTGEIVFDRILIELLPLEKVTFAVRGGPIINDCTMEDAVQVGLTRLVRVIDTGSNVPGIFLPECSNRFRECFETASLVIAKGQGNFETLSDVRKNNLFHLLLIKCPLVARQLGGEIGALVAREAVQAAEIPTPLGHPGPNL